MTVTIKIDNPIKQNQSPSIGTSCAVRSGAVSPRFSTEMVARVASKDVFTSAAARTNEDNHKASAANPNGRRCENLFSKNKTNENRIVNVKAKNPISPKTCLPVILRFGRANIIKGVLDISMLITGKIILIARKTTAATLNHLVRTMLDFVVARFTSLPFRDVVYSKSGFSLRCRLADSGKRLVAFGNHLSAALMLDHHSPVPACRTVDQDDLKVLHRFLHS